MTECQRCESELGMIECQGQECVQKADGAVALYCKECNEVVHRDSKLSKHNWTPKVMTLQRNEIEGKMKTCEQCLSCLDSRLANLNGASNSMQELVRVHDRNLKETIVQLQTLLKNKAGELIRGLTNHCSEKMQELEATKAVLEAQKKHFREHKEKLQKLLAKDDSELVDDPESLEMLAQEKLPRIPAVDLPDLNHVAVDLSDLKSAIGALELKLTEQGFPANEDLQLPPLECSPGAELFGQVASSLTTKGIFWFLPSYDQTTALVLHRISMLIRASFLADPEWQTYAVSNKTPEPGELVYVQCEVDGKWHRGRTENAKAQNKGCCFVRYIDYGYGLEVPLSRLLPCKVDVAPKVGPRALECCLFSDNQDVRVLMDSKWVFNDHVQEALVSCTLLKKLSKTVDSQPWHVIVRVEMENGDVCNVSDLVEEKMKEESSVKKPAIACRDIRITHPELFSNDDTVAPPPQSKHVAEAAGLTTTEIAAHEAPAAVSELAVSSAQPETPCRAESKGGSASQVSEEPDLASGTKLEEVLESGNGEDTPTGPPVYAQPRNMETVERLPQQVCDKPVAPPGKVENSSKMFSVPSLPFPAFPRVSGLSTELTKDSKPLAGDTQLAEVGDFGGRPGKTPGPEKMAVETESKANAAMLDSLIGEDHGVIPNSSKVGNPGQVDSVASAQSMTPDTKQIDSEQSRNLDIQCQLDISENPDFHQQLDSTANPDTQRQPDTTANPDVHRQLDTSATSDTQPQIETTTDLDAQQRTDITANPDTQQQLDTTLDPATHVQVQQARGSSEEENSPATDKPHHEAQQGVRLALDSSAPAFLSQCRPIAPVKSAATTDSSIPPSASKGIDNAPGAGLENHGHTAVNTAASSGISSIPVGEQDITDAASFSAVRQACLQYAAELQQGSGATGQDMDAAEVKLSNTDGEPLECSTYFLEGETLSSNGDLRNGPEERVDVGGIGTDRQSLEDKAALPMEETRSNAHEMEASGKWVPTGVTEYEEKVAVEQPQEAPPEIWSGTVSDLGGAFCSSTEEQRKAEDGNRQTEKSREECGPSVEQSMHLDKEMEQVRGKGHKEVGAQAAQLEAGKLQHQAQEQCTEGAVAGHSSLDAAAPERASQVQEIQVLPGTEQECKVADQQSTAQPATRQGPCRPRLRTAGRGRGAAEERMPPGRPLLGSRGAPQPTEPVTSAQWPVEAKGDSSRIPDAPDGCLQEPPSYHENGHVVPLLTQNSEPQKREGSGPGTSQTIKGAARNPNKGSKAAQNATKPQNAAKKRLEDLLPQAQRFVGGQNFGFVASEISARGEFWLRLSGNQAADGAYASLHRQLLRCATIAPRLSVLGTLSVGQSVLVQSPKDERCFRGCIESLGEEMALVRLVDVGTQIAVPTSVLKELPDSCDYLPLQAMHCCLCTLDYTVFCEEAQALFHNLTHNKEMRADVTGLASNHMCFVRLYFKEDESISIQDLIRKQVPYPPSLPQVTIPSAPFYNPNIPPPMIGSVVANQAPMVVSGHGDSAVFVPSQLVPLPPQHLDQWCQLPPPQPSSGDLMRADQSWGQPEGPTCRETRGGQHSPATTSEGSSDNSGGGHWQQHPLAPETSKASPLWVETRPMEHSAEKAYMESAQTDGRRRSSGLSGGRKPRRQPRDQNRGNMQNVRCYNCDELGHMSRECPQPKSAKGFGGRRNHGGSRSGRSNRNQHPHAKGMSTRQPDIPQTEPDW